MLGNALLGNKETVADRRVHRDEFLVIWHTMIIDGKLPRARRLNWSNSKDEALQVFVKEVLQFKKTIRQMTVWAMERTIRICDVRSHPRMKHNTDDIRCRIAEGLITCALEHAKDGTEDDGQSDLGGTVKVGCTLHVRGINGDFETEEGLRQAFSAYGKFSSALVRQRTDEVGNNTSWALVTMGDEASADRALAATVKNGKRALEINRYSVKRADSSTGGMAEARRKLQRSPSRNSSKHLARKRSRVTVGKLKAMGRHEKQNEIHRLVDLLTPYITVEPLPIGVAPEHDAVHLQYSVVFDDELSYASDTGTAGEIMLKDILQVAGAPIKTGHDLVTTYFVQSIIQDDGKATLSLGQSRLREHHGVDARHLAGAIEHFHEYNLDIQPPTLLKPVLQLLMTIPPDIHALSFNVQLGSAGLKMIADR